ncbi:hypothetical protein NM688_g9302 [Phlebia brevispora]|uniref:Uncharacterized protein n=1 Tax=Phlebia brevispora TaxID=194682 RepID=A0ACC1RIF7_9APHY|nr:hypothetical protein NM688_g9302 [Phlebia brevispora]
MAQDEETADQFREDRLVERCWIVWKQGYQWILTTNEQIAQARESLLVRQALHQWRTSTTERREMYRRVASLSDSRCLKVTLQVWREKLKQKQQVKWRQDMRARMKTVRDNHDARLKQDAWMVWKQKYHVVAADRNYCRRLLLRFFSAWKGRKSRLDQLQVRGEDLISLRERSQMERCWALWRHAIQLRQTENIVAGRVDLRILSDALDTWKRRLRENQGTDRHYDFFLMRRTLLSWKAAMDRLKVLDRKAAKHTSRQNDVLVRAVWRVWKAHERGKTLERVRTARFTVRLWQKWQDRLREQREREDLAVAFSLRSSSVLASSSLKKWMQVYKSHRNAEAYAVSYCNLRLQYRMMDAWRLQLRYQLQQFRAAKRAEKFFTTRKTWKKWLEKLADRKRERQVTVFEKKILQRYLHVWSQRAQDERQRKLLCDVMQERVNLRIMTNALNHWTNRVVDIKFRELEVGQQSDREVQAAAFKKWKELCIRHVEELSLMESYKDVKREAAESMRRVFYRWLNAARQARHKRLLLQEKEEQLKLTKVAHAWDKWREQYLAIRLQPMADAFLIQRQQNLVFRAFGIWHSRSTSLPAIRFHASHLKAKSWRIWRDSMPKALQSKRARESDRKAVLSKAFAKWVQAYKTKLELKAVARARYLRLPTAAPRQIGGPQLRAMPSTAQSARENDKQLTSAQSSPVDEKEGSSTRPRPTGYSEAIPGEAWHCESAFGKTAISRAP